MDELGAETEALIQARCADHDTMERQLHMARYIAHAHAKTRYTEAVLRGQYAEHQARVQYAMVMANYDELLRIAAEGYSMRESNQIDMDAGFRLPEPSSQEQDDGG